MVIKNLADNYPNSGSLIKTLNNFDKDLDRKTEKKSKKNYRMLVSILVDIALKNPRIHPVFASILSKIICDTDVDDRTRIIKLILKKFKDKPNSERMCLWLQRIVIVANIKDIDGCSGKLFTLVTSEGSNEDHLIWNSKDWLHDDFYQIIKDCSIIDTEEIDNLPCVIENKEVNRFYY